MKVAYRDNAHRLNVAAESTWLLLSVLTLGIGAVNMVPLGKDGRRKDHPEKHLHSKNTQEVNG
ncbi:MAG: hypothetical protein AB4426_05330 [Xenococcaceae cyanobacterium]